MSSKRYINRIIINNDAELFEQTLDSRNLKFIRHYTTAKFRYPTESELSRLNINTETWKLGDRLYKYSYKYYGSAELWWIIAWFNQKPTDGHFNIGDEILIPTPLDKLYVFFEM